MCEEGVFGQVCVLMVMCEDNHDYDNDMFAGVGAVDILAKKHVPSLQRMNTYNLCNLSLYNDVNMIDM